MSMSQVILSIIEIAAVITAIIGLFNEEKLADFERAAAKKLLRKIARAYKKRQKAKAQKALKNYRSAPSAGSARAYEFSSHIGIPSEIPDELKWVA